MAPTTASSATTTTTTGTATTATVVQPTRDATATPLDIITAFFTGMAAIATAVAAIAAWRSAQASERTSRDAMEGLANTIRPSVRTRGVYQRPRDGRLYAFVVVANESHQWDASDVNVKVHCRDGTIYAGSTGWLKPTSDPNRQRDTSSDDRLEIEIGEIDVSTPEAQEYLVVERVITRYKDARRIGLYECKENFFQYGPFGQHDVTEERISIGS